MKTEGEFFFPYQSIFITARAGVGASTLARSRLKSSNFKFYDIQEK
jgi:hypothetical protein